MSSTMHSWKGACAQRKTPTNLLVKKSNAVFHLLLGQDQGLGGVGLLARHRGYVPHDLCANIDSDIKDTI